MLKAHRVYAGQRFCSACYPKVFERRPCPKCTLAARLPKSDLSAICSQCAKNMPCARCGKEEYRIGKITEFGPVCNSCSVYFRARQVVPERDASLPQPDSTAIQRLPSISRGNRGTCQSCRRHRKISVSADGRRLCVVCSRDGIVPCPSCNCEMPAGRGNLCESCYWRDTFFKRLTLDEAGLSSLHFVLLFRAFGIWLLDQVPAQKAALAIHRYFSFFYEMEKRWNGIPIYPQLVAHFSAEGLRRVRLPMRWLLETSQVHVDSRQREDASDQRRIDAILASIPSGTPASTVLLAYKEALQVRLAGGQITLRTVRLSLRPAASLLTTQKKVEFDLPAQSDLDHYLLGAPGQKAAITGFISFINTHYSKKLLIRVDKNKTLAIRRKKLEKEIAALVAENSRSDEFRIKWLSVGLAYFHGLSRNVGPTIAKDGISTDENGNFCILWKEKSYWLPHWNYRTVVD